jgi:O-antigen/teichoic acid export membrane protein
MDRIKKNVLRVSCTGMMVVMPLLAIILFATRPYVRLAVGDKWLSTVPMIKAFVLYLTIMSISFSDEAALIVVGKIRVVNAWRLACSLLTLALGYLAVHKFNVMGMAISYSLVTTAYLIVIKRNLIKTVGWTTQAYVAGMRKALEYCVVLLASGYVFMHLTSDTIEGLALVVLGVGIAALIMLRVHFQIGMKKTISEVLPWGHS